MIRLPTNRWTEWFRLGELLDVWDKRGRAMRWRILLGGKHWVIVLFKDDGEGSPNVRRVSAYARDLRK